MRPDLLDSRLHGGPNHQPEEMLPAVAIYLLCISPPANDPPTMADVVAMLTGIRRPATEELVASVGFIFLIETKRIH